MGNFCLYDGDRRTGMVVTAVYEIWANHKPLQLPQDIFHISFFDGGKHVNVVDMPTLEEAKKLAESYYEEWLKVKRDGH